MWKLIGSPELFLVSQLECRLFASSEWVDTYRRSGLRILIMLYIVIVYLLWFPNNHLSKMSWIELNSVSCDLGLLLNLLGPKKSTLPLSDLSSGYPYIYWIRGIINCIQERIISYLINVLFPMGCLCSTIWAPTISCYCWPGLIWCTALNKQNPVGHIYNSLFPNSCLCALW